MDINENEIDNANYDGKINVDVNEANNNFNLSKDLKASSGDIESSQSDGSKTLESREERIKRLKEQSEMERQRKLAEIMESQRQSHELRQKQQIERRKKIEELKLREEERRRGVELRRRELDEKEKEKAENMQKRNKEREARAALSQKPLRAMSNSMSQSMISPRQNRMTTSMHSGTSSGSEKCMKKAGYGRWPSSCDVDRVSSYVSQAAGKASNRKRSASNTRKPLQPPEGFLEVDGHFIPASTRHAGCFLPYKGPRYHVKGVLAWGPPRNQVSEHGSSTAWWASIEKSKPKKHQRASSVHSSPIGSHGTTCPSIPCYINQTGVDFDNDSCSSPHSVRERLVAMDPANGDIRSKLNNYRASPMTQSVKMIKAFSQHHLYSTVQSDCVSGKDTSSARLQNRSKSRTNVPAISTTSVTKQNASTKQKGDSIFDRLSKPRSGSQPPKSDSKDPSESSNKLMSTSFTKPAPKIEVTKAKEKKKSTTNVIPPEPISQSKTTNEEPQLQVAVEVVKEVEPSEASNTTTDDVSSNSKPSSQKNKNVSKSPPDTAESNPVLGEEVAYKMKLAEQRRIAREKKEEQMEEQRRIEEEARQKAALEKKKMEEEARMLIEEETKRARLLEDERVAELERQRLIDEAEKKKRDDDMRELEESRIEKLRLAEEERMDRKRRLEKIMSRVKRTDESSSPSNEENPGSSEITESSNINDDKNEPLIEVSLEEQVLPPKDDNIKEESPQPTEAWTAENEVQSKLIEEKEITDDTPPLKEDIPANDNVTRSDSPELLSDAVLHLSGPESHSSHNSQSLPLSQPPTDSPGGDQAPQFKSRLLQSMLGSGRLNSKAQDDRALNSASKPFQAISKDKRNSSFISQDHSDSYSAEDSIPHSKSYHTDMGHIVSNGINRNQAINGLSYESGVVNGSHPQIDSYNGITLSNINSNIDPPRIPLDKLELRSESGCSQFSSEDCPPPTMPPHCQALELS